MGPPGTRGFYSWNHTGGGRPRDPQQPTSGVHGAEPAGNAHPPPSATMDEDTHGSATPDPGPDTQAPPAASSRKADTAGEVPCPQATHQPEAGACTVQATGGTERTDAGGQGTTCTTDGPPAVLHEEWAGRAAGGAHPAQLAAAEERVHPGTARSWAQVETQDNPPPGAPETEEILAFIFNQVAPTSD